MISSRLLLAVPIGLLLPIGTPLAATTAPTTAPNSAGPDPVALLAAYVQVDTQNPPGNELRGATFLKSLLDREGIENELIEVAPGRACIAARLKGTGGKPGLILSHHIDVVTVERSHWSVDPFAGVIKDGYLYGRGSLDMKASGITHLLTLIRLKREKVVLDRDLLFLGTVDEEVDGLGMTTLIAKRPDLFKGIGFSITEGDTIAFEAGKTLSWNVDVSEKSALWLRLTAHGHGGHGSIPNNEQSSVLKLLAALDRIRSWESPIVVVPTVARHFSDLAGQLPGLAPEKLQNLSRSLQDPAFKAAFLAGPERAAQVQNTLAITVLKGGPQTNVIPSEAYAELDIRLLPGQDPNVLIETIRATIADPSIEIQSLTPVVPCSESSSDTELFQQIARVAARFDPGVPVTPTILTSTTESSLLRPLGIEAYGFEPYRLTRSELMRSHGDDERISLEELRRASEIVYAIVSGFVRTTPPQPVTERERKK